MAFSCRSSARERRKKSDGLGMGLVISRSIAEAHDGEVTLAARPDGKPGAAARLVLPMRSETVEKPRAEPRTERRAARPAAAKRTR